MKCFRGNSTESKLQMLKLLNLVSNVLISLNGRHLSTLTFVYPKHPHCIAWLLEWWSWVNSIDFEVRSYLSESSLTLLISWLKLSQTIKVCSDQNLIDPKPNHTWSIRELLQSVASKLAFDWLLHLYISNRWSLDPDSLGYLMATWIFIEDRFLRPLQKSPNKDKIES